MQIVQEERGKYLHDLVLNSCCKNLAKCAIIYDDGVSTTPILFNQVQSMTNLITEILRLYKINHEVVGYFGNVNTVFASLFISILRESSAFFTFNIKSPSIDNSELIRKIGIKWIFIDEPSFEIFQNSIGCQIEKCETVLLECEKLILVEVKSQTARKYNYEDKWRLAYVVSTSGTTGKPKIIYVPHRCILPNIWDLRVLFEVTNEDVICLCAPLTFDPSIVQLFLALTSGCTVLILSPNLITDSYKFSQLIIQHNVTILQSTPSTFKRVGEQQLRATLLNSSTSLRVIAFGGEPCPSVTTLTKWREFNKNVSLFNIYGITEVSSWATVHRITEDDLINVDSPIPLGKQLTSTLIEVRNLRGETVKYGEGELYVGGCERICIIDDEDSSIFNSTVFRSSGDWVHLRSDGHIQFLNRIDYKVKRYGNKLDLSILEDVTSNLHSLDSCCAVYDSNDQFLWLFVVVKDAAIDFTNDLKKQIYQHLQLSLQPYALPTDIFSIDELPVTAHGKINTTVLLTMARNKFYSRGKNTSIGQFLLEEWKKLTNICEVNEEDNFVNCGGDSIKVIQLSEKLVNFGGRPLPLIADKLLNSTFKDVSYYAEFILDEIISSEIPSDFPVSHYNFKNFNSDTAVSYCRGGEYASTNVILNHKIDFVWKFNTDKCVDASPLIVLHSQHPVVYIGSHSHKISAILLNTGQEKWTTILGDRIESSACLSVCSTMIFVGCYDNFVYALHVDDGRTIWRFRTSGPVKCSPVIDPLTGAVYVGSHDHNIYSLNSEVGSCNWKLSPGNGSIFASPCVTKDSKHLYIATLDGILCSIDPITGCSAWKKTFQKPIFSSPMATEDRVIIVDVGGDCRSFSHDGREIWRLSLSGPVFSTPCLTTDVIVLGTHSKEVHCIDINSGNIQWSARANAAVYSSPFCIHAANQEDLVTFASTDGHLHLISLKTGDSIITNKLPGEIFSSPVLWDNKIVVGCRDNFVYCFTIK